MTRTLTGKMRSINADGVVVRHGVGTQNSRFLRMQGLFIDIEKHPDDIANDATRLVSLLRLSNRLHPETEKFFRHTVKHLR